MKDSPDITLYIVLKVSWWEEESADSPDFPWICPCAFPHSLQVSQEKIALHLYSSDSHHHDLLNKQPSFEAYILPLFSHRRALIYIYVTACIFTSVRLANIVNLLNLTPARVM